MKYVVSEASAAIRARLRARGATIFSPVGEDAILLKQLDPALPLAQYGGIVRVIEYANGSTRILGVAGPGSNSVFEMEGELIIPMTQRNLSSEFPGGIFLSSTSEAGFKPAHYKAGNPVFNRFEVDGTTARADSNDSIVDELVMGWICPSDKATIYEGAFRMRWSSGITRENSDTAPLTFAVLARVPIDMPINNPGIRSIADASIAGADPEIRGYVSQAWREHFDKAGSTVRLNIPVVIGGYAGSGYEVGMHYYQRAFKFSGSYINQAWNAWTTSQVDGAPLWEGNTVAVEMITGSSRNGLLIPRLSLSDAVTASPGSSMLPVAPVQRFVATLPQELDGEPAANFFGHLFPGVYADPAVPKGGVISLTTLACPVDTAQLQPARIIAVAATESDAGNASAQALSGLTSLESTGATLGYDVLSYWRGVTDGIADRAEALARADRPFAL